MVCTEDKVTNAIKNEALKYNGKTVVVHCITTNKKPTYSFAKRVYLITALDRTGPATLDCSGLGLGPMHYFLVLRGTTHLQYIEDSEPVVDGSRDRWCAVQ